MNSLPCYRMLLLLNNLKKDIEFDFVKIELNHEFICFICSYFFFFFVNFSLILGNADSIAVKIFMMIMKTKAIIVSYISIVFNNGIYCLSPDITSMRMRESRNNEHRDKKIFSFNEKFVLKRTRMYMLPMM